MLVVRANNGRDRRAAKQVRIYHRPGPVSSVCLSSYVSWFSVLKSAGVLGGVVVHSFSKTHERADDHRGPRHELVVECNQFRPLALFDRPELSLDACYAGGNQRRHVNRLVNWHAKVNDVLESLTHRYDRTGDCAFTRLASKSRPAMAHRDPFAPD